MKTIPTLTAAALALVLILSPMMAFAAGSITFSSPAAGSSFKGTQSYTIAGTVSPAPGVADNVFVSVKNAGGSIVDAASVSADPTTGAFSYSTSTGGSTLWVTGTYTISATDSYGATGTTTFAYTAAAAAQVTTGAFLEVQVAAATPVYAGQTVQVDALVTLSNGTIPTKLSVQGHYYDPTGAAWTSLGASKALGAGMYQWTVAVPKTAADGLYDAMVYANSSSFAAWGSAGFTVNSQIANQKAISASLTGNLTAVNTSLAGITSSLSSMTTAIGNVQNGITALQSSMGTLSTTVTGIATTLTTTTGSLQTAITGLQSSMSTLSTSVSGIQTSINTISSDMSTLMTTVSSLQTTVSGLSGLSSQMTSLSSQISSVNSAVSANQTYVLVVAALAAITLVLELAILIRKLS